MPTTSQQHKEIVRRFFDAWNEADFEAINVVVAADAVSHNPFEPSVPSGPEGEKQLIQLYHSAFSDATITIEDMVAEGNTVAVRWIATGTHDGEFMGIQPTGTKVEIVGFEINRLDDGQIVESWGLFDGLGLLQQLEIVEPPSE